MQHARRHRYEEKRQADRGRSGQRQTGRRRVQDAEVDRRRAVLAFLLGR
jgi:hypothetical protein